ncbi:MAG TPA: serine/threonine-protein kinase [Solirubrobacteraceae bacterium]
MWPLATESSAPVEEGAELAEGLTVLEHLSRNQVLDVYDVWDAERYCRCVAKTPRPDHLADARAIEGLRLEGELLSTFAHPHIVRAYEVRDEPQPILLLETLSGEMLDHLIAAGTRRMQVGQLAVLGIHLGSAIRYLHRAGYLHLDLKPSNVVVDQGFAKLLDLSLTRPPGPGPQGLGTRRYLAPEQALGEPFTAATDVWGLGMVLYESATRRLPFSALGTVKYPQVWVRAVPIRALRQRLPGDLAAAIDACLASEPEQRPSVDTLLDVFAAVA